MHLTFLLFLGCLGIYNARTEQNCYYACNCQGCDLDVNKQECPSDDDYCYTLTEPTGVSKGCLVKELLVEVCPEANNVNCTFCRGNLCNSSASQLVASMLLLVVALTTAHLAFL